MKKRCLRAALFRYPSKYRYSVDLLIPVFSLIFAYNFLALLGFRAVCIRFWMESGLKVKDSQPMRRILPCTKGIIIDG